MLGVGEGDLDVVIGDMVEAVWSVLEVLLLLDHVHAAPTGSVGRRSGRSAGRSGVGRCIARVVTVGKGGGGGADRWGIFLVLGVYVADLEMGVSGGPLRNDSADVS